MLGITLTLYCCFNPRPRTGGDRQRRVLRERRGFQSTPPHGGRPKCREGEQQWSGFNPRPRTGGDMGIGRTDEILKFQSTPPHGGRHGHWANGRDFEVSIHAPARGATMDTIFRREGPSVSIHAPARGATMKHRFDPPNHKEFQSTPPHGGRPRGGIEPPSAPGFNPRPRTGGDVPSQSIVRSV